MIRTEVRTNAPTGDKCIRLLMDAEKRGAARVKRAQKFRAFKIRQARIEAEAAVHDFRDEKEAHVQEILRQIKKEVEAEAEDYEKEIRKTLEEYDESVKDNRDAIIQQLIEEICNIKPSIHHNFTVQKHIAASEAVSKLSSSIQKDH